MKKLTNQLMTYLFLGLLPISIYSQSLVCQVIGTTGGSAQIGDKIISYALGESVISTIGSPNNNILTQGFFQPEKTIVGTLSIDEKEAIEISIFPNPTQDKLNIELSSTHQVPNLEVQILNYLGQSVSAVQQFSSPSRQSINCQQLAAGYYFLSIKDTHRQKARVLSFVKTDNR